MHIAAEQLRALHETMWNSDGSCLTHISGKLISTWAGNTRVLDNSEKVAIFHSLENYPLIVVPYTSGNEGIGLIVWEPDPTLGEAPYPGIEYDKDDLKFVIRLWQDNFFEERRSLNSAFEMFLPYVMRENNQKLLTTYKFSDKEKNPILIDFEY